MAILGYVDWPRLEAGLAWFPLLQVEVPPSRFDAGREWSAAALCPSHGGGGDPRLRPAGMRASHREVLPTAASAHLLSGGRWRGRGGEEAALQEVEQAYEAISEDARAHEVGCVALAAESVAGGAGGPLIAGGPASAERIFVSIASYRDPEALHTIRDLFDKADHPERIFVGVVWQYVNALPGEDSGGEVVTRLFMQARPLRTSSRRLPFPYALLPPCAHFAFALTRLVSPEGAGALLPKLWIHRRTRANPLAVLARACDRCREGV
ncbi:hypothetical protein CYMTET_38765 [Cymbomonas tetramitiformis]|uniref:Uncharacterized protein n=1 Tax=Cymbomonas tetramitiformis TaxID=36881 RepID=A0AAE0F5C0_9CHLO|nr:hypothetical protein CYMTET_38765 [Cymbomonas tetramitiformis]